MPDTFICPNTGTIITTAECLQRQAAGFGSLGSPCEWCERGRELARMQGGAVGPVVPARQWRKRSEIATPRTGGREQAETETGTKARQAKTTKPKRKASKRRRILSSKPPYQRLAFVLDALPQSCTRRGTVGLKFLTDSYNDVSPASQRLGYDEMPLLLHGKGLTLSREGLAPGITVLVLDEAVAKYISQWKVAA
ncbi:hypothetical protein JCM16814_08060 [Desulfobaculum senezii]